MTIKLEFANGVHAIDPDKDIIVSPTQEGARTADLLEDGTLVYIPLRTGTYRVSVKHCRRSEDRKTAKEIDGHRCIDLCYLEYVSQCK